MHRLIHNYYQPLLRKALHWRYTTIGIAIGLLIIIFSLFGTVFGLLLWGKFRYDLVAFAALMLAGVLGVVDAKHAFDGFGHPATLVVALVLVISAGPSIQCRTASAAWWRARLSA